MNPVILDVDSALGIRGGDIDDAHAIAFMAAHLDRFPLAGISITAGNVTQPSGLRSAAMIVKALKLNVEIAVGRDRPLEIPLVTGHSHVVGGSQVEEWILPESGTDADAAPPRRDAVAFIASELKSGPRILLPTAPLSTIAAFLQTHPDLAGRIERIVTMGGWFVGDNRPAEFNVKTDPAATAIVYASGIPTVITPFEMTMRTRLVPEDIADWKDLGRAGRLFHDGTLDWIEQMRRLGGEAFCCLHDPLAAGYLCYPELFETQGIVPGVDEMTGLTRIVARDESSPVRLIVDFDLPGFKSRFREAMRRALARGEETRTDKN